MSVSPRLLLCALPFLFASVALQAAEAPVDPLVRLKQRLEEKLGAMQAPEAGAGNEIRLAARTPPPTAGKSAVASERPPAAPRSTRPGAAAPAPHAPPWGYQGEGAPQRWGALQPEFSLCAKGSRQSPIDIRDGIAVDLQPVQFDYRAGAFSVIDNGHTVQTQVARGNTIEVTGRRYELVQFHFHRPSEERIDGRQYEMSLHLVHRDPEGRLAVVAVLLERGAAQSVLQQVLNNLPLEKGELVPAAGEIDPAALLPADRRYYTYMGSLTTPPCSEGVLWLVMQQPVPASADQIGIFSRLYPMNARPVQQAAGRLIKQSN